MSENSATIFQSCLCLRLMSQPWFWSSSYTHHCLSISKSLCFISDLSEIQSLFTIPIPNTFTQIILSPASTLQWSFPLPLHFLLSVYRVKVTLNSISQNTLPSPLQTSLKWFCNTFQEKNPLPQRYTNSITFKPLS